MISEPTAKSIDLLEESLEELESSKGSIHSGIQKLSRAAKLVNNNSIYVWCKAQLGDKKYTMPLKNYIEALINYTQDENKKTAKKLKETTSEIKNLGFELGENITIEGLGLKNSESSGGFANIGFIEERYSELMKNKKGNDGKYYRHNLSENLNYIKKTAHDMATKLYDELLFSKTPKTVMDVLKNEIDDKLLDLNPELAEQLMLAFQSVSKDQQENWSQALTTCRRTIEKLADILFPSIEDNIDGRKLGKNHYINRIWAFMDQQIESESNKELAKSHVDLLGAYLEKINRLTNKGVHTNVKRIESIKTVLHTYLMIGDIINYLDDDYLNNSESLNIYKASLDELQSYLDISKSIAKEIVKLRVKENNITLDNLGEIKGIGPKTLEKAEENFSFEVI